jgi:hypothetical protein
VNYTSYADLTDRRTLNDELEALSYEVTLTYSKVLYRHLPRQTMTEYSKRGVTNVIEL